LEECAFCLENKNMTREHLWPASLHKRLKLINDQKRGYFWLNSKSKILAVEPKIQDVCADCNNGILSQLDNYICNIFDSNFSHMPEKDEVVSLEYDYHLLKRWLLKMCYNSARISNSPDLFVLKKLLPYILGENEKLSQSVQIFLQLTYPQKLPEDISSADIDKLYPDINRVGFMQFKVKNVGQKLLRAVHIRSYMFILSFWEPGKSMLEQYDFENVFLTYNPSAHLLTRETQTVKLRCNAIGAYESVKNSRNTKFKSD